MESTDETFERVAAIWDQMDDKNPLFQSFGFDDAGDYVDYVTRLTKHFKRTAFESYAVKIAARNAEHDIPNTRESVMMVALAYADADTFGLMMLFGRERERLEQLERSKM